MAIGKNIPSEIGYSVFSLTHSYSGVIEVKGVISQQVGLVVKAAPFYADNTGGIGSNSFISSEVLTPLTLAMNNQVGIVLRSCG